MDLIDAPQTNREPICMNNSPAHNSEPTNNAAARSLSEAEQILGITGPKYTIVVDGHLYRLLPSPDKQPAKAASLFAEMLFVIRNWLGEHPEAAKEMDEYPVPMDDEMKALPFPTIMSIALGVSLEMYAHKHGGSDLVEHEN